MTLGLDTSVVLRLITGEPVNQFAAARARLERAYEDHERVLVSDMVLAEAYHALHHHYGVPKEEARRALRDLVASRWIELVPGASAGALEPASGAGLVDRLIHWRYIGEGAASLTFDEKFARLDGAARLE